MTPKEKESGSEGRTQIIVATIGLLGVLGAAWIANRPVEIGKPPIKVEGPGVAPDPKKTQPLPATADFVTYTIVSAKREPFSDHEYLLTLEMKVSCQTLCNGLNFWEDLFRLEVDGVKEAPLRGGSNYFVRPDEERKEEVLFVIPNKAKVTSLTVGRAASGRTAKIAITPETFPLGAASAAPTSTP